jgi:hypothetical protein
MGEGPSKAGLPVYTGDSGREGLGLVSTLIPIYWRPRALILHKSLTVVLSSCEEGVAIVSLPPFPWWHMVNVTAPS